jgi:hypothetical protein
LSRFRELAPKEAHRDQRWSFRQVALIVGAIAVVSISLSFAIPLFFPTRGAVLPANCDADRTMIAFAQAVPTATKLPCVSSCRSAGRRRRTGGERQGVVQVGIGDGTTTPIVVTLTATPGSGRGHPDPLTGASPLR